MKSMIATIVCAALVALQASTYPSMAQDDDSLGVTAILCEGERKSVPILIRETAEGLEWNIDGRTVERRGRDFAIYEEAERHLRVYLNRRESQIWKMTTVDFGDVDEQICRDVTGFVRPIAEYASGLAMGQVSKLEEESARLRQKLEEESEQLRQQLSRQDQTIRQLKSENLALRVKITTQIGNNQRKVDALCKAVDAVLNADELGVQQRLVLKSKSGICR